MTRMQKWQSYRDEIAKQTSIGKQIAEDDINLQKYKTEIDKINPAILASIVENQSSLHKGVSDVQLTQTEISTSIANMFATINKTANAINHDTVESIFHVLKNDKIVDKDRKFMNDKLLAESKQYRWFKEETKNLLAQNKNANDELTNELETKYNNFTSTKEQHKVDPVIVISKNSEKQASHYVFVISMSVSILMLIIVISLFIAKAVLR